LAPSSAAHLARWTVIDPERPSQSRHPNGNYVGEERSLAAYVPLVLSAVADIPQYKVSSSTVASPNAQGCSGKDREMAAIMRGRA
jgi:hypothetical protein